MATAHLGGVRGRWEFVVGGPAITQTCGAEQLGRPGDVVLSAEVADQVCDTCAGEPVPAGRPPGLRITTVQPLPPVTPLVSSARQAAGAALRGYVPGAILARLDAGQSAWLSELRHVSVLFLRLPDLDDIARALRTANNLVREVQEALYEYEGSVNKLGVDDKGTTMVAAFGLPPVAHEDDGVRAVRAALGIQAQLRRHTVRHAIGIATGRAFCGSVGSDLRREYTMIGGVVNRGARLMQTALDDLVCDRATHQAANAKLTFEPLPPRRVKGVAEPVAVFRPHGLRPTRAPGRSLVGRAHERRLLLTERLRRARRPRRRAARRGGGRDRQVTPARRAGHPSRRSTGQDAGRSSRRHQGHHAVSRLAWRVRGAVRPHRGQPAQHSAHPVLEWLRDRPNLKRLAPLLGDVLPLDLPHDELVGELQGQVRGDNTRRLLVGALQVASAAAALLIVVEDAHWCDSASWALARLVAQRIPTALLVLALRPLGEPSRRTTSGSARRPMPSSFASIPCRLMTSPRSSGSGSGSPRYPGRWPSSSASTLAATRSSARSSPHALRDTGVITITNGSCRLAPGADLHELSVPDTVQGVVLARIDRLAPPQQLTLKVASVIGRSFAYRLLHDVYPIIADRPTLADQLEGLQQRSLVLPETPEQELAWMFKHVITRDVAYELMVRARRRCTR